MYGMNGNFGGMPYQSPAASLTGGIEAGIGIVQNQQALEQRTAQAAQDRQDRLDQQQTVNQQKDTELRMQQARDDMTNRRLDDAEQKSNIQEAQAGLDGEVAQLRQVGQQRLAAAGNDPKKIDPDAFAGDQAQWADINKRQTALNQARGGAFLNGQMQIANQTVKQMSTDPTYLDNPANADSIAHAITLTTHMDGANFLRGPNGQSNFEAQQDDFNKAFSTQDLPLLGKVMGTIFKPQLEAGRLGMYDPLGGLVSDVSLHGTQPLVPSPHGQSMMPVLSVTGTHPDGSVSTQPAAFPAAAGFAHDDNQEGHTITPGDLAAHMGNLGIVQAIVNSHPGVQAALRASAANPNPITQDAAAFYTMLGSKADHSTLEKIGENERFVSVPRDAQGNPTGPPVELLAPTPLSQRKPNAALLEFQAGQSLVGQPHLRPDEEGPGNYTQAEVNGIQSHILPRAKAPTASAARLSGEDAAAQVATQQGVHFDAQSGAWRHDADGKQLSQTEAGALQHQIDAAKAGSHQQAGIGGVPGTAKAVTTVPTDHPPGSVGAQYQVYPANPADRVIGQQYRNQGGGVATWTKTGWVQNAAPAAH